MPNETRRPTPPPRSPYAPGSRPGQSFSSAPRQREPYAARPASSRAPQPRAQQPRITSPDDLLDRMHIPEKWHRAAKLFVLDILLIAVGLLIFAYFHHVRSEAYSTDDVLVITRPSDAPAVSATADPAEQPDEAPEGEPVTEETPVPTETPAPTPEPIPWSEKFADKFTDGEVKVTDTSYRSENISVTINSYSQPGMAWYVADIYIADIENYLTAFAEGKYGKGLRDWPKNIAAANNAIVAVTGDYYGTREKGVVIRNGAVYRTSTFKDLCILYYDGVMETMSASEFNPDEAIARGAYQAFSFGPQLLDENGVALKSFNSEITETNPRCAIGYFEPGHYCFVVVDGRQEGYSDGMEMSMLATVFQGLGCKAAYNLDGGQTAAMIFMGEFVNKPLEGGRQISDIVYIGEVAE